MSILIIIIGFILRLISLNQSFWLDEAAQATISSQNLLKVNWAADFQPPLFYIMTFFWQKIGIHSEWFLRLLSVFFGVLTIYVLYRLVKEAISQKAAVIVGLLLATAPFHIYFSQEYRMYSLLTLLVSLSWYCLWKRRYGLYAVLTTLSLFTHYFSVLAIISQILYMIVTQKKEGRKFFRWLFIGLMPFIFWVPILVSQIKTAAGLISVWPDWKTVAGVSFFKFPFLLLAKFTVGQISPQPKWLYMGAVLIVGLVFTTALFRLLPHPLTPKNSLFIFYFFIPVALAWISGLWITGNSPHRLLFVLPAFYAIIACGLSQWKKIKVGLISILLFSNIFFSLSYLLTPKFHREDWKSAVLYSDNKIGNTGYVLTEYIGPWAPMAWYSKKAEKYLGGSSSLQLTEKSVKKNLDSTLKKNPNNIVLYSYLFEISDPEKMVEKYLVDRQYKLVEEKDFRGVGIVKVFNR